MSLSVCMIVKDEQHQIIEAVQNFLKFADEIVVVDTGDNSTANKLMNDTSGKLRLTHFNNIPFQFDVARNHSLHHANCDWIMWLDADDRIEDVECDKIKKLISLKPEKDRYFKTKVINTINGLPLGQQFVQSRILPNIPGVKFEGEIHESAVQSLADLGLKPVNVDIRIMHTGYETEASRKRKANRNIHALSKMEPNARNLKLLGDAYMNADSWQFAIDNYSKALETADSEMIPSLHFSLGLCYKDIGETEKALGCFNLGINLDRDNMDCFYQAGKCYEDLHKFKEASECYVRAMQIKETYTRYSNNYHWTRIQSFFNAARIATAFNQFDKAVEYLNYISTEYPKVIIE